MRFLVVCFAFFLLASCSEELKKDTKKVTEDFTGATTIKTGNEMKSKIDSLSEIQEKRTEEFEKLLQ